MPGGRDRQAARDNRVWVSVIARDGGHNKPSRHLGEVHPLQRLRISNSLE